MLTKIRIASLAALLAITTSACGGAPVALSLVNQVVENPVQGDLVISLVGESGDPVNLNLGDLSVKEYTTKLANPSQVLTLAIVGTTPAESVTMRAPEGDTPKPSLTMTVSDDQISFTWGTAANAPTATLPRKNPVREARERVTALAKVTLAVVEPYVALLAGAITGYDKDWIRIGGSADAFLSLDTANSLYNKWAKQIRIANEAFEKVSPGLERSADEAAIALLIDGATTYGNMLYSCFHGAANPSLPSPATCYGVNASLKTALDAALAAVRAKAQ